MLEAFKFATLTQHAKNPKDFPMDLAEHVWYKEVAAYVLYTDVYGDIPDDQIDALLGDSDGPDGA